MNAPVRIGTIKVDLETLEVRGRNRVSRLEPKAAAVLARLAETPGQVVARDELIRSVWGHLHVSKDTLAVTIHRLRKALAEAAETTDGSAPVETVPRRGYRLRMPMPAQRKRALAKRRLGAAAAIVGAAVLLGGTLALRPDSLMPSPDGPVAALARAEALWERREPAAAVRAVKLVKSTLASPASGSDTAVRAHALLGRFYGYKTAHWLGLDRSEAAALGRHHLERAIELGPRDPDVLTTAASFALYTERDMNRAYRFARAARALDPQHVAARQTYAKAAAATGDAETAVATIEALAAEAPADGSVQWDRAFLLFLAGRHEASLRAIHNAEALTGRNLYWLEAFNHHGLNQHLDAAAVWADHLNRNSCPVTITHEVTSSFRRLLEAEQDCDGGFAYRRALWAHYAGLPAQARHHFDAARAADDYILIWHALNPLPYSAPALAAAR